MPGRHVVVDGSNIATEGRTLPSLAQLDQAVQEFLAEHPDDTVTVVVDASFAHRIDASELKTFEEAEEANEVVSPPAGAIGRGDAFLLRIADRIGATVLSNDSFQEFHGEYEWLFEPGRLIGGKPVPGVGWIFTPRTPVRGPRSREAVKEAKRRQRSTEAEGTSGLDQAAARTRGQGSRATKRVATAIATATEEVTGADGPGRRRRRKVASPPSEPVNEPLAFITFIAAHPLGSEVTGSVESFSSHGAFVEAEGVRCYIPLSAMGDPPPRKSRDVLARAEERAFVVQALDPQRRGVELALPGFAKLAGSPTEETVEAEIESRALEVEAPAPARARRSRKAAAPVTEAPAAAAAPPAAAPPAVPADERAPLDAQAPARARRSRKAAGAAAPEAAAAQEAAPTEAAAALEAAPTEAAAAEAAPLRSRRSSKQAPPVEPAADGPAGGGAVETTAAEGAESQAAPRKAAPQKAAGRKAAPRKAAARPAPSPAEAPGPEAAEHAAAGQSSSGEAPAAPVKARGAAAKATATKATAAKATAATRAAPAAKKAAAKKAAAKKAAGTAETAAGTAKTAAGTATKASAPAKKASRASRKESAPAGEAAAAVEAAPAAKRAPSTRKPAATTKAASTKAASTKAASTKAASTKAASTKVPATKKAATTKAATTAVAASRGAAVPAGGEAAAPPSIAGRRSPRRTAAAQVDGRGSTGRA